MSIAAISSSFVGAVALVRDRDRTPAVAPARTAPATEVQAGPKAGRRHELVDAMQQVLGVDALDSKQGAQAVFRFAHALMHDLRKVDTGADAGPGRAWGRRAYTDLPQRLAALAGAAAAPAPAPTPPAAAPTAAPAPGTGPAAPPPATGSGATPPSPPLATAPEAPFSTLDGVGSAAPAPTLGAATPPAVAELPQQPDPLTATSAALHLMQVPSSRLLEAYAALSEALGSADRGGDTAAAPNATATADGSRAALADFLTRLSATLSSGAAPSLPAGSLLSVRA